MRPHGGKDRVAWVQRFLICSAFATWCFLDTWIELAEGDGVYFARYNPLRAVVPAVICWEIAIAAVLLLGWGFFRSHPRWFLLACLFPLGIAAAAASRVLPVDTAPIFGSRFYLPVAISVALVAAAAAIRHSARASRTLRVAFLYSWPVLALILLQAWRGSLRFPDSAFADAPPAAALHGPAPPVRVLWIIFDELSQQIVFDARPASLKLPNFDRLKGESFYASAATSPSAATDTSLPSLLTGELVRSTTHVGPNGASLRIQGKQAPVDWSEAPNVFDDARHLGFDTALAGWYHPYGRLLNRSLTRCAWIATWLVPGIEEPTAPQPLAASLLDRAELQLRAVPLLGHIPALSLKRRYQQDRIERFSRLLESAREFAADPRIGLVFLHLPVPHWPAIYSRTAHRLTAEGDTGYLDNVALADETLGILRHALEAAGQWDRTAILVSSDHGWRTRLWRSGGWTPEEEAASRGDTMGVPFLLHLPDQRAGAQYDKPFDTIVSRPLVISILKRELTDATRVAGELERLAGGR